LSRACSSFELYLRYHHKYTFLFDHMPSGPHHDSLRKNQFIGAVQNGMKQCEAADQYNILALPATSGRNSSKLVLHTNYPKPAVPLSSQIVSSVTLSATVRLIDVHHSGRLGLLFLRGFLNQQFGAYWVGRESIGEGRERSYFLLRSIRKPGRPGL
jgi:hypothetical protein